jgi:hypothetical protein
LNKELDIRRFVKNMRYIRNMLQNLGTGKYERKLIRMQADYNVMDLKLIDKKGQYIIQQGVQNSSDFDTDDQRRFIESMERTKHEINLTRREMNLLKGIPLVVKDRWFDSIAWKLDKPGDPGLGNNVKTLEKQVEEAKFNINVDA